MTEIREAPRELLTLILAMRGDWDHDQTWSAMLAAHAAGWPFTRTLREAVRLALIEDSRPADLRYAAGETRLNPPGSLSEAQRAQILADAEAATQRQRERASEGGAAA